MYNTYKKNSRFPKNHLHVFSALIATVALVLSSGVAFAQSKPTSAPAVSAATMGDKRPKAIEYHMNWHRDFDAILQEFVDDAGWVDYDGLKDAQDRLDAYVAMLEGTDPDVLKNSPAKEQMAFWINAYNALCLQRVLNHYPIKPDSPNTSFPTNSIMQIPGVWKEIQQEVAGKMVSLDKIEHEILRPTYKDARIHVAVNCASVSCPILQNRAFTASNLEELMEKGRKEFAESELRNQFDLKNKKASLSQILNWFPDDFVKYHEGNPELIKMYGEKEGSLLSFYDPYLPAKTREAIRESKFQVEFLEYDWRLNSQDLGLN
jgi:hypothetical protein